MANIDFNNLDPEVVTLARAIRAVESNGNFNAVGDNGDSHGAYQFNKGNFQHWATQFGLDPNDFSPVNQDKVAYAKMKAWKDQGYHAGEIAAMWNGAHITNGRPVANNPNYIRKVQAALGQQSSSGSGLGAFEKESAPTAANPVDVPLAQPPAQPSALEKLVTDPKSVVTAENAGKVAKKAGKGLLHTAKDFGIGVVKGIGNLENRTAGALADKILPPIKNNPHGVLKTNATPFEITKQQMTPNGRTQKVGNVVGEYVLPAAAGATTVGAGLTAAGVPVADLVGGGAGFGKNLLSKGKGLIGKALAVYGASRILKNDPVGGLLHFLGKFTK